MAHNTLKEDDWEGNTLRQRFMTLPVAVLKRDFGGVRQSRYFSSSKSAIEDPTFDHDLSDPTCSQRLLWKPLFRIQVRPSTSPLLLLGTCTSLHQGERHPWRSARCRNVVEEPSTFDDTVRESRRASMKYGKKTYLQVNVVTTGVPFADSSMYPQSPRIKDSLSKRTIAQVPLLIFIRIVPYFFTRSHEDGSVKGRSSFGIPNTRFSASSCDVSGLGLPGGVCVVKREKGLLGAQ